MVSSNFWRHRCVSTWQNIKILVWFINPTLCSLAYHLLLFVIVTGVSFNLTPLLKPKLLCFLDWNENRQISSFFVFSVAKNFLLVTATLSGYCNFEEVLINITEKKEFLNNNAIYMSYKTELFTKKPMKLKNIIFFYQLTLLLIYNVIIERYFIKFPWTYLARPFS